MTAFHTIITFIFFLFFPFSWHQRPKERERERERRGRTKKKPNLLSAFTSDVSSKSTPRFCKRQLKIAPKEHIFVLFYIQTEWVNKKMAKDYFAWCSSCYCYYHRVVKEVNKIFTIKVSNCMSNMIMLCNIHFYTWLSLSLKYYLLQPCFFSAVMTRLPYHHHQHQHHHHSHHDHHHHNYRVLLLRILHSIDAHTHTHTHSFLNQPLEM